MLFNAGKCKVMHIRLNNIHTSNEMNGVTLEKVLEKYLGIAKRFKI